MPGAKFDLQAPFQPAGDQPRAIAELTAGRSYYRALGVEHDVINANEFEFVFVEVEFKAE